MKVLLIADEESPYLWDFYQPGRLAGVDVILSCGDLKQEYLEFLEENGWSVVFSKELSARISMMYAECERLS